MGVWWDNILWLGIKEFRSLRADPVLLFMIAFAFTVSVYTAATGMKTEVENAPVGIVDEDRSELSRRVAAALLEPYFATPVSSVAIEPLTGTWNTNTANSSKLRKLTSAIATYGSCLPSKNSSVVMGVERKLAIDPVSFSRTTLIAVIIAGISISRIIMAPGTIA